MIDIENYVFTQVRNAVKEAVEDCYVTSAFELIPEKFPCVQLTMVDNHVYERTSDENVENHAVVVFQVEVFTAFTSRKKEAARFIYSIVDGVMSELHFVRTMYSPLPNMDKTIYRITGRYRAVVSQPQAELGDDDSTTYIYNKE